MPRRPSSTPARGALRRLHAPASCRRVEDYGEPCPAALLTAGQLPQRPRIAFEDRVAECQRQRAGCEGDRRTGSGVAWLLTGKKCLHRRWAPSAKRRSGESPRPIVTARPARMRRRLRTRTSLSRGRFSGSRACDIGRRRVGRDASSRRSGAARPSPREAHRGVPRWEGLRVHRGAAAH